MGDGIPIIISMTVSPKHEPTIKSSGVRTLTIRYNYYNIDGWLGSRVVSVRDSGAEGPEFKSQSHAVG